MVKLIKAINTIFTKCLAVKKDEKVLIVTDDSKEDIANEFLENGMRFADIIELIKIPILEVNGIDPPKNIQEKMLGFDVIIALTTKSISHTKTRIKCTEKGIRLASMPGITKDILERTIDVDYEKMKNITDKIADVLDAGKKVRIATEKGTDLMFSINGRNAHGRKSGIYDKKGYWGNLPEGEAFIAPVEGTANGTMMVDGSIAGIGLVDDVEIKIKDGFAVEVKNKKFNGMINSVKDKNARNIAEFGIGTNENAQIKGIVLEDEKVLGTCHIALGNNFGFGGKIDVPFHVDCVIRSPTIYVDDKKIIEDGKLLI